MTKPLVEVLMSTYNGRAYVAEQVDSILNQSYAPLRLLIRDDGSTDETREALAAYLQDPRVRVLEEANLGLPDAFFHLIDIASDDADLLALADQDDVWVPDKIERAVAQIQGRDGPAMYCARVLVVDEQLTPLYPHERPRRGPSFANALVQNIAIGCTVVINRRAREVLQGRWPQECVMHDAWMYLVLSGTGTVVYDEHLVVKYRQHDRNSVGMGRGPGSRLAGRVRRQLAPEGPRKHSRQDRELRRLYGAELQAEAFRELERFLASRRSVVTRIRYALTGRAHRQSRRSDVVLRVLGAMGRI